MTNFEIISAITDNIEAVLKRTGLNVACLPAGAPESMPAGMLPAVRVWYTGETFDESSGERPSFSEAGFLVNVVLAAGNAAAREEQRMGHAVRGALSVDGLNTGALEASRPVSRIKIPGFETENRNSISIINMKALVRYRQS